MGGTPPGDCQQAGDSAARCQTDPATERLSLAARLVNLSAVFLPFLGLVIAAILLWGTGFSWIQLCLLLGMYVLTALGITVGYHRLFTHRSFKTHTATQWILTVLGSMAAQGTLIQWVACHRRHHQKSDKPGDPHSPHLHGQGIRGVLRGLWHSHVGWVFDAETPRPSTYVPDLLKSRNLRLASQLFPLWVAVGLVLPALIGGLLAGSWMGAWLGLLWGGLVRIFLVHHVTWSVNSICHFWGTQPFPHGDHSKNNFLFGLLAMGEGWHNNHHAFPTSARHGLRWWQIDISYFVIRALELLGLAWDVKLARVTVSERGR